MTLPSNRSPSSSAHGGSSAWARTTGADATRRSGILARAASVAIGVATAVVIFGAALGVFFNPVFVGFEQE